MYSEWNWPKPVSLIQPSLLQKRYHPFALNSNLKNHRCYQNWDPKSNRRDALHLMPILTPAYPSMNSAYNVGNAQLRRIQTELWRARQICDEINRGKKNWNSLLSEEQGTNFFRTHQHYLEVTISASTTKRSFQQWFGICEAKLRILIASLDNVEFGIECHPFSKCFTKTKIDGKGLARKEATFYVALRFAYGVEKINITELASEYLYIVNSWENRTLDMDLRLSNKTRESIPENILSSEASGGEETNHSQVEKQHKSKQNGKSQNRRKRRKYNDDQKENNTQDLHLKSQQKTR